MLGAHCLCEQKYWYHVPQDAAIDSLQAFCTTVSTFLYISVSAGTGPPFKICFALKRYDQEDPDTVDRVADTCYPAL